MDAVYTLEGNHIFDYHVTANLEFVDVEIEIDVLASRRQGNLLRYDCRSLRRKAKSSGVSAG